MSAPAPPGSSSAHGDVTVVVTCFNYGAFLAEAVASALGQDGGAPVVIVVDDGSTDPGTLRALEELPPVVRLVRQANAGLSAARNAGLRLADTPYLIVLDADDRLTANALHTLKAPLAAAADGESELRLGFTYGRIRYFGDWNVEPPLPGYDPWRLLYRHVIGSTCLMRRQLYEDVGGFDPETPQFEDWDFWLGALEHGWGGKQLPEVTFEYRRHGMTMLGEGRREYRVHYRRLRAKHRALYERERALRHHSDLGPAGRALYRTVWAWRPVPPIVEHAAHNLVFGALRLLNRFRSAPPSGRPSR